MELTEAKMAAETTGRRPRVRKTIGLLIDWISTPYHADILDGIQDFCEARDLNLSCIVSGRLGSNLESESCRNILTDLVHTQTVDGLLVCASSLQNFAGHDFLQGFLQRYDSLPMVTLHESFPGIASVSVDNVAGSRFLMEHLAQNHGYKRFAFLRGLPGNRDFDERYQTWRDYLREQQLPINEDCIVEGDYKPQAGIDAVRHLLAQRNNIDVLVCANDAMAFGAQDEARNLGWNLPVVGFDDVNLAERLSLTTVRQSVLDQVGLAGEMLLKLMDDETIPLRQYLPPWLVVRGSCGCPAHQAQVIRPHSHLELNNEQNDGSLQSLDNQAGFLNDYDLEDLHDIGEKLFSSLSQDQELDVVAAEFPRLGIDACNVCLYDDPSDPLSTSRLIASYDQERVFHIAKTGIQFPTRSVLPHGILDRRQRRSLMVQALFHRTEQIGFVVFSMNTRKWRVYEMLRRELSTALKTASLLRSVANHATELEHQVRLRTKELEEANAQLKLEILERTRVEAELARREEHYHDLALLLPTMVLELDLNYRLGFINRAGLEMLELVDMESGRGESFLDFVHEEDSDYVEEMFEGIIGQKQTTSGEFRILSSSKKSTSILFVANAITRSNQLKGIRLSGINIGSMFSAAIQPEELLFKHYHFSPRVKEVLLLMLQGHSSKQMAQRLSISENTIKAHIRAIYLEVGVENRSALFKVLREYQVHHFGYQSYVFSMLSTLIKD